MRKTRRTGAGERPRGLMPTMHASIPSSSRDSEIEAFKDVLMQQLGSLQGLGRVVLYPSGSLIEFPCFPSPLETIKSSDVPTGTIGGRLVTRTARRYTN